MSANIRPFEEGQKEARGWGGVLTFSENKWVLLDELWEGVGLQVKDIRGRIGSRCNGGSTKQPEGEVLEALHCCVMGDEGRCWSSKVRRD
jgi:hypothetical protein